MPTHLVHKALHYDPTLRRLWIHGQRWHHGTTGTLLAAAGLVGLAAKRLPALAGLIAAGGVLMAHDWKDRARWFARGWQE
jgi:hypothetical protein